MRTYETTILVHAARARADYESVLAEVRGYYEAEGIRWLELEKWDERRLAYPIKKETSALYLIGYFEADPAAITRVERRCQLSDLILRQLIVARPGPALAKIKEQRARQAELLAVEEKEREG